MTKNAFQLQPPTVAMSIATFLKKSARPIILDNNVNNDERTKNSMRQIKIGLNVIVLIILLVASGSSAQTQGQMNDEACRKYQQAEAEMNRVYKQVLAEYKSETTFIKKLGAAQRAWLAFRDAHLEAMYPEIDKARYGSVYPMCRCDALSELTRERTKMLKKWTTGNKEGDVCTGSVKIKR